MSFKFGKSTITNSFVIIFYLIGVIEKRGQVDVIITDF